MAYPIGPALERAVRILHVSFFFTLKELNLRGKSRT